MKKIMTAMLGLSLVFGAVSAFAQSDTTKTKSTTKTKKMKSTTKKTTS